MRLTRTSLAALGVVAALAVAIPVGINFADTNTPTAAQSPATQAETRQASTPDPQHEAQAKRIATARAKYGVHFDHPANKGVTDPTKLLPYTNVWADIEFKGQTTSGGFRRPVVKTYGDVKVRVSAEPRKVTRPNADQPGSSTTFFVWDVTVAFGNNVTYYQTMYNDNRGGDASTVRGWDAFIGDNDGNPIEKTAVDYVATHLTEHVIYTGTDPAQPRDGAMGGLPITWNELATQDMHLPV
ncbi:MAG TPA: hypothetical protein VJM46_05110 [Candidatus Saccharimonadales bacterium]|nr:hypothetical protein [Candidatus Saccharimonadales bacterium]